MLTSLTDCFVFEIIWIKILIILARWRSFLWLLNSILRCLLILAPPASQNRRKILLPDFLILRKLQLSLCVSVLCNQFDSKDSPEIRILSTRNPIKFPYAQIDGENLMQRWNKQILLLLLEMYCLRNQNSNPHEKLNLEIFL